MNLSDLRAPEGQNHRSKRVGRGFGSGMFVIKSFSKLF